MAGVTTADWLREQAARDLDTDAQGEDMAADMQAVAGNTAVSLARREKATILRQLAAELRALGLFKQAMRRFLATP